jgi:hypothetical protein
MENNITAEKFLASKQYDWVEDINTTECMIEFAKLKCEEQLTAILENVKTKDDYSFCGNTGSEYPPDTIVDKDSILNAYDLNNIK